MNKLKKVLITTVLTFALIFNICISNVFADVGDFETYDSGYSSSSSSDWSSSSGDSNYDYENNDSTGDLVTDIIVGIATVIGIVVVSIFIGISENIKNKNKKNNTTNRVTAKKLTEDDIVAKIKMQDENFNKEEFISWAKDLFIKLQYAWSDRDWSTIRCFETQELFEQHSTQLERYKKEKKINKMERVSVNWAKLNSFNQVVDKDIITILLNSKMVDYIIDEDSKAVLKGDPNLDKIKTYKLTFIRKIGVKTKLGETTVDTKKCPNCGAPTQITSAGKCEYCGSIITTGEFNWVLSNLEPYNGY